MKILLPFSTQHGKGFYDNSVVVGGIEKFCHSIYESFDDVEILEINDMSNHEHNTTLIKQTAMECGADIIISNWIQASFAGAKIVDSQIPIMVVCHENSSMLSTLPKFKNIKKFGHSLFFVNPYQKRQLDKMSNRVNDIPIEVDGYVNSCYVSGEKPKIEEPQYECCTIGRCDPRDKKPFVMKTLLKNWDDVLWDLEHEDVMNNLSKCKTFFQTYPNECFSITALESLSYGIPLILNTKDDIHSSEIIPAMSHHYKKIELNSKEQLIDAIKSFDGVDRKEIQDATWEKHTHKNWISQMESAINKTIDNFNKKNGRLNEYFI